MITIAIANQKGGCGKTTTAVNLSACLAEAGYKALLLDLDPQAHATLGVGVEPSELKESVYEVLTTGAKIKNVLLHTRFANLDIIPSNILLSGTDLDLVNVIGREGVLKDALAEAHLDHDFCVIDCSPSLSVLTVNALVASGFILIPIQTHYYAMEGMKQLFGTIDIVKRRINRDLKVLGILPTFLDRRTNISKEVLEGVREYFKERVFQTQIHSNVKLTEAPSAGEPVIFYDPHSSGANDYRALTQEILRRFDTLGFASQLRRIVPAVEEPAVAQAAAEDLRSA